MSLKTEEGKRFPISFRTTAGLRDKINDAAKASGRSVAQELEWRLERSFLIDAQVDMALARVRELEAAARSDRETIQLLIKSLAPIYDIERLVRGNVQAPDARQLGDAVRRAIEGLAMLPKSGEKP